MQLAMEGGYDLLLLDSMLPGIDGLALLAALRKSKQTPVLMLTVRVHGNDRVRGRQGGVDDDLSKPFAVSGLTARIQVRRARALEHRTERSNMSNLSSWRHFAVAAGFVY